MCPDIMSTGFSAAERGHVRIGDAVAVFAQGPIGLCAAAGAQLCGASLVIGVDAEPKRLEMARRMGADVVINYKEQDVVAEIKRLTGGGVDVAIEALGAGLGDQTVLTTLCPGGKERMRRLMNVVRSKRFPFRDLITHTFKLEDIDQAYDLFSHQRDGVMKVAIRP
jgi:alcohol dehydrogenase